MTTPYVPMPNSFRRDEARAKIRKQRLEAAISNTRSAIANRA